MHSTFTSFVFVHLSVGFSFETLHACRWNCCMMIKPLSVNSFFALLCSASVLCLIVFWFTRNEILCDGLSLTSAYKSLHRHWYDIHLVIPTLWQCISIPTLMVNSDCYHSAHSMIMSTVWVTASRVRLLTISTKYSDHQSMLARSRLSLATGINPIGVFEFWGRRMCQLFSQIVFSLDNPADIFIYSFHESALFRFTYHALQCS